MLFEEQNDIEIGYDVTVSILRSWIKAERNRDD